MRLVFSTLFIACSCAGRHHNIPAQAGIPLPDTRRAPLLELRNKQLQKLASLPIMLDFHRKPNSQGVTMANSAQARKRARQADKQREHNASLRSELRTAIKKVAKAIEAGDKAAAQAVFSASTSVVDSIADKKIIHKNKAARHKSRLSAAIKAMA
jgi:small subunit ribosomal protein S20